MTAKRKSNALTKIDKATVSSIDNTARLVYTKIQKLGKPELKFPQRSLSNVTYDRRVGHFKLGRARKERTLTVNTVKNFAQTLKLMALSKEMVLDDDFASKRTGGSARYSSCQNHGMKISTYSLAPRWAAWHMS